MLVQHRSFVAPAILSFLVPFVSFVQGVTVVSSSYSSAGVGDFVASGFHLNGQLSTPAPTVHAFVKSVTSGQHPETDTVKNDSPYVASIITETASPIPSSTVSAQNSSLNISSTTSKSSTLTHLSLSAKLSHVSSTRPRPSAVSFSSGRHNAYTTNSAGDGSAGSPSAGSNGTGMTIAGNNSSRIAGSGNNSTGIFGAGNNSTNSTAALLAEIEELTGDFYDIPYENMTLSNGTMNMSACYDNWQMYFGELEAIEAYWYVLAMTASTSHLTSTSTVITSYTSRFQDVTSAIFTSPQQNWTTTLSRTDYSSWAANFSTSWSTFQTTTTFTPSMINASNLGIPTPTCSLPSVVPSCQAQWDAVKPMDYDWSVNSEMPDCQQAVVNPSVCSVLNYEYTGTQSGLSLGPGCTADCKQCLITGKSVELIYWPIKTMPGHPDITITPTEAELVTATAFGTTFTSPTVYISFDEVWANNRCGALGTTHSGSIIAVTSSDVSTITNEWGIYWAIGEPNPPPPSVQASQLNLADLNQPVRRLSPSSSCSTVLHEIFHIPAANQVLSITGTLISIKIDAPADTMEPIAHASTPW